MSQQNDDSNFPPDSDANEQADRSTSADVEAEQGASGPAERNDEGNDSPAITSPAG